MSGVLKYGATGETERQREREKECDCFFGINGKVQRQRASSLLPDCIKHRLGVSQLSARLLTGQITALYLRNTRDP